MSDLLTLAADPFRVAVVALAAGAVVRVVKRTPIVPSALPWVALVAALAFSCARTLLSDPPGQLTLALLEGLLAAATAVFGKEIGKPAFRGLLGRALPEALATKLVDLVFADAAGKEPKS